MSKGLLAKRAATLAWSIGLAVVLLGITTAVILPSTKKANTLPGTKSARMRVGPEGQSEESSNAAAVDTVSGSASEERTGEAVDAGAPEVIPERVVSPSQNDTRPVFSGSKSVVVEVPVPLGANLAEEVFATPEELNTEILEIEPEDPFETDKEEEPEAVLPLMLPSSKRADFIGAGEAMISLGTGGDE